MTDTKLLTRLRAHKLDAKLSDACWELGPVLGGKDLAYAVLMILDHLHPPKKSGLNTGKLYTPKTNRLIATSTWLEKRRKQTLDASALADHLQVDHRTATSYLNALGYRFDRSLGRWLEPLE